MRHYTIELRMDCKWDNNVRNAMDEVVASATRMVLAQANMVNPSKIVPTAMCYVEEDVGTSRKVVIDHTTLGLEEEPE